MADIARTRAYAPAPPWRLIAVALLLIALVVAALVFAGSQRKVAPPFGPARNGDIVYDQAGDLYVGNPETGASRLLVGGPGLDHSPSYSPDGSQVAFFRDVEGRPGVVDIYNVNADGSNERRVTALPISDVAWANWTPDSRHLAVISGALGPGRLELLDADGKEAPIHPAPDLTVDGLAFRPPNGQEIAVRAIVGDKYGIYAVNADGSGYRTLSEPTVPLEVDMHANELVYTPDGTQLFYQRGTTDGCCQLWVMNADGSNAHRFETVNDTAWSGVPTVSPDGRWVSYWYVGADAPTQQVRVAPVDGSRPAVATGPVMSDFFPWLWSPDSSQILMFADDGSNPSAYLINPEGGSYSNVPWESGSGLDWQRLAP
jgi:Tol biopolymer transport system component